MAQDDPDDGILNKAWDDGKSNNIIILGQPYLLPEFGAEKRVINFVDDPSIGYREVGKKEFNIEEKLVRLRKPGLASLDDLKKLIQYVVLHTDISPHANQTFRVLVGRGLSSHFCINWNGMIYQNADIADYTAHAGGDANPVSIGIDMNLLIFSDPPLGDFDRSIKQTFDRIRPKYRNLAREKLKLDQRGLSKDQEAEILDEFEFEQPKTRWVQGNKALRSWGYTPRQYEALIALLKLFVRVLDLEKSYPTGPDGQVFPTILADDDLKKAKGFIAHWHISVERWDPGPAFDWERVLSAIMHEQNSFPVMWSKDHVIQTAKDVAKVQRAAYTFMRNNETAQLGGTFPMGPNQTWHGGIHLFPEIGLKEIRSITGDKAPPPGKSIKYPVYAMFDGVVVAAHFEPTRRDLGHNNFILMRHDLEIPDWKGRLDEEGKPILIKLRVFTLYMHLEPMDVTAEGAEKLKKDAKLEWVSRLHELYKVKDNKAEREAKVKDFDKAAEEHRKMLLDALDKGLPIDEDLGEVIILSDEELSKEESKPAKFLKYATGVEALLQTDKVAVLASDDLPVKVTAGEVIGFVGELIVPTAEGTTRPEKTLHVEVFCNEEAVNQIDFDIHAEQFRTPQRARSSDITVRTEDILAIFRRGANRFRPYKDVQLWADELLDPEDIKSFYSRNPDGKRDPVELYREQLRRSITYHVSEWSDQVDWIASLVGKADWGTLTNDSDFLALIKKKGLFSREIRKILPFIWLTKDVAADVGLLGKAETWDGRIYHFHPIHFLMWVSYDASRRNRVYRTPLSLAQLREKQGKETVKSKLVREGIKAEDSGDDKAWRAFQDLIEKELAKPPFGLDKKTRQRRAEKEAEFTEIKDSVLERVHTKSVEDQASDVHGVIEDYEPTYQNPKEVLQDLFNLPGKREWRVRLPGEKPGEGS